MFSEEPSQAKAPLGRQIGAAVTREGVPPPTEATKDEANGKVSPSIRQASRLKGVNSSGRGTSRSAF